MTPAVTFDVREPLPPGPWPRTRFAGRVYDADTGGEVGRVRRAEFLPGWVRLDNGDVRGTAVLTRLKTDAAGLVELDRASKAAVTFRETRRVVFRWERDA